LLLDLRATDRLTEENGREAGGDGRGTYPAHGVKSRNCRAFRGWHPLLASGTFRALFGLGRVVNKDLISW